ncbi:unnamed protein product [Parnassius apollo]|uniref:(apollo) hypothetical protein n=1 Tax=Parnassius apollo TaxID=110799 RepID=A0A8S3XQN8_PARAO|nr:unnamed protein product [Parnassius apollo]
MPKPQYSQKFRDSWLQDPDLKEWLQAVESTAGQVAKCKFCGTILRSHYGDLKTHALSKNANKIESIYLFWTQLKSKEDFDKGRLNFSAIGARYGYPVEESDVVTEDGYILKIFHIAGNKRRPVLLLNVFVYSADTFIIRGNKSLDITLTNNGYDVWALNARGTR